MLVSLVEYLHLTENISMGILKRCSFALKVMLSQKPFIMFVFSNLNVDKNIKEVLLWNPMDYCSRTYQVLV